MKCPNEGCEPKRSRKSSQVRCSIWRRTIGRWIEGADSDERRRVLKTSSAAARWSSFLLLFDWRDFDAERRTFAGREAKSREGVVEEETGEVTVINAGGMVRLRKR